MGGQPAADPCPRVDEGFAAMRGGGHVGSPDIEVAGIGLGDLGHRSPRPAAVIQIGKRRIGLALCPDGSAGAKDDFRRMDQMVGLGKAAADRLRHALERQVQWVAARKAGGRGGRSRLERRSASGERPSLPLIDHLQLTGIRT